MEQMLENFFSENFEDVFSSETSPSVNSIESPEFLASTPLYEGVGVDLFSKYMVELDGPKDPFNLMSSEQIFVSSKAEIIIPASDQQESYATREIIIPASVQQEYQPEQQLIFMEPENRDQKQLEHGRQKKRKASADIVNSNDRFEAEDDERKLNKRARQLENNRAAAKKSRQKKKSALEKLNSRCEELQILNDLHRQNLEEVYKEFFNLRSQIMCPCGARDFLNKFNNKPGNSLFLPISKNPFIPHETTTHTYTTQAHHTNAFSTISTGSSTYEPTTNSLCMDANTQKKPRGRKRNISVDSSIGRTESAAVEDPPLLQINNNVITPNDPKSNDAINRIPDFDNNQFSSAPITYTGIDNNTIISGSTAPPNNINMSSPSVVDIATVNTTSRENEQSICCSNNHHISSAIPRNTSYAADVCSLPHQTTTDIPSSTINNNESTARLSAENLGDFRNLESSSNYALYAAQVSSPSS
ncbi:9821_t:CDS:2, partial [Ambispora gerdemannii]